MAFKLIVLCAFLASVNAGVTVTSTSDNTYRSPGNLAQLSTESKTVTTPYASSSNSNVRVSNPSVYVTATPSYETYAPSAPIYTKTTTIQQQPINYHAHPESLTYAQIQIPHATYYQQQALHPEQHHVVYQQQSSPPQAIYSANNYYNQASHVVPVAHQAVHAQPAYSHPIYSHAPAAVASPIVKVAYSPAAEVAHLSYSNVNDHINYAW